MSGGSGPSGVDAVEMKKLLLSYGKESYVLGEGMVAWTEWLGNESPP